MNLVVALKLGRVSNLPTVWTNVLAGLALAGGGASGEMTALVLLALSLFYLAGMYLNDAFDHKIDAEERPDRPIPSGQVSLNTVAGAGFGMLLLGMIAVFGAGLWMPDGTGRGPAVAGFLLAIAIIYYNWNHKNNRFSPLIMGICRMLVYVAAASTVTAAIPPVLYAGAAMLLCYLIGLTYAAKQENLNQITHLWPLAFLAVPFAYLPWTFAFSGAAWLIYLGFAAWTLYALSFLVMPSRLNVPKAVVSLLAGICLLDALLIAGSGHLTLAWVAIAGFVLTLALQRWIPGT